MVYIDWLEFTRNVLTSQDMLNYGMIIAWRSYFVHFNINWRALCQNQELKKSLAPKFIFQNALQLFENTMVSLNKIGKVFVMLKEELNTSRGSLVYDWRAIVEGLKYCVITETKVLLLNVTVKWHSLHNFAKDGISIRTCSWHQYRHGIGFSCKNWEQRQYFVYPGHIRCIKQILYCLQAVHNRPRFLFCRSFTHQIYYIIIIRIQLFLKITKCS